MGIIHINDVVPTKGLTAQNAPKIVVICGSPTTPSKTEILADMVAARLQSASSTVTRLKLRDLPAQALVEMTLDDRAVAAAVDAVKHADGIVIATPTYKASFSGLLKLFLDALPQFGFADKVVLPLATGGTLAHVLALDYGLRPVLQSMGARWVVPSYFVTSDAFLTDGGEVDLAPKFKDGLDMACRAFQCAVDAPTLAAA